MQACEKCGAEMVIRKNRQNGSQFLACSAYPKCKNAKPLKGMAKKKLEPVVRPTEIAKIEGFVPSKYQQRVFDAIRDSNDNLVIEAVAGSGKTTTIVQALDLVRGKKVCFISFNNKIVRELESKAPAFVEVMTIHKLGRTIYNQYLTDTTGKGLGPKSIDKKKTYSKVESHFPPLSDDAKKEEKAERRMKISDIVKFIKLCKGTMIDYTNVEQCRGLCDHFGIEEGNIITNQNIIIQVMEELKKITHTIEFEDMYWLPMVHGMGKKQYDIIFCDEAQDMNKANAEFVRSMGKRIIAVGDRFQSIYGFTGADCEAIPSLIEVLNARIMPLSICYRCPLSHVQLAQSLVPTLEARPNAPAGTISNMSLDAAVEKMVENDIGICRNNAPLTKVALSLIKKGKKAVVLGRSIGDGLVYLIRAMGASSTGELAELLSNYRSKQVERFEKTNNQRGIEEINDNVDCIFCFIETCDTIDEILQKIEDLFSEDRAGITFSSVHRAKGSEAKNVFLMFPELMPSKLAKKSWEIQQEMNLLYVAYTRAKENLTMVSQLV